MRVTVRTPLNATEDPARVAGAIANLFPDAEVTVGEDEVRAVGGDLEKLAERVRVQQVSDSARSALLRGVAGNVVRFRLAKQAAAVGKAAFDPPPQPLGELEVTVEAASEAELLRAIYHVAPDTTVAPELAEVPPPERPTG